MYAGGCGLGAWDWFEDEPTGGGGGGAELAPDLELDTGGGSSGSGTSSGGCPPGYSYAAGICIPPPTDPPGSGQIPGGGTSGPTGGAPALDPDAPVRWQPTPVAPTWLNALPWVAGALLLLTTLRR